MKDFDLPIAWKPTKEYLENANVTFQMRKYGLPSYEAFLERSFEDPEWFWQAFFEDTGFEWFAPYQTALDLSAGKPWAKWFPGGQLNWVHNALDRRVQRGQGDRLALVWEGEEGSVRRYTYRELLDEVIRLSNRLLSLGIQPGDRVGLYLPFIPEVAIALMAVSRIGAIALPLFSGFGPEPIQVRLNDAEAKLLFVADGFPRRGKPLAMKEVADEALKSVPSIEKVILVRRLNRNCPIDPNRDIDYQTLLTPSPNSGFGIRGSGFFLLPPSSFLLPEAPSPSFPSDHPCMIIYTSGTTGRPKGAYHVHAGFPIKSAQDMYHLFDLKPTDTISWVTDIGWMMGPWLIMGGLLLGATLFMYDGSPDYPAPDRLWEMVDRHRITALGITPTLIRALMRESADYPDRHPMASLRLLGSTGEPWNPEPWQWTFEHVGKKRAPIINYSGGTEISGGILGCVVLRPLKPCCFNTAVPGVYADVLNEEGQPARDEVGYLVVRNVNPGMTRGFWRDPDRYVETYWNRWEGVWDHGDLSLLDLEGYWYILGRADDTLKIAGKRVGPAEIESVLVEHPAVVEAGVIGVPDELKGQAAVAFVVLKPGYPPSPELEGELLQRVAQRMGKPLMPKAIKFVPELPKTRNAKIMRRVIRSVYLGEPPGDLTALENPASVEAIRQIRE